MIQAWETRDNYIDDMNFLDKMVWPQVKHDQISHDAYFCEIYENAHPFPTRRYSNFQHVGQVFDAEDRPVLEHIEMLRLQEAPLPCRKHRDWVYG